MSEVMHLNTDSIFYTAISLHSLVSIFILLIDVGYCNTESIKFILSFFKVKVNLRLVALFQESVKLSQEILAVVIG